MGRRLSAGKLAFLDAMEKKEERERREKAAIYNRYGHYNSKTCPKCGRAMKLRDGKYGEFWGCSGYPNCKYTEQA